MPRFPVRPEPDFRAQGIMLLQQKLVSLGKAHRIYGRRKIKVSADVVRRRFAIQQFVEPDNSLIGSKGKPFVAGGPGCSVLGLREGFR